VSQTTPSSGLWRFANILVWFVLFVMGLQPEHTFFLLRQASHVVTQSAFINSYYVITYAFTGYLVWFTWRVCRAAGLSSDTAQGKAIQVGLLALLAFLPMRLEQAIYYHQIAVPLDRWLNVTAGIGKCLAWLYLFSLILRYYTWEGPSAFVNMRALCPSAREDEEEVEDLHAEESSPAPLRPASGDLAPDEPVTLPAAQRYNQTDQ
jgi:hypothetical protein